MEQRHLFILDPLESLNLELDSSLRLAKELAARSHKVDYALMSHLAWDRDADGASVQSAELDLSGGVKTVRAGALRKQSLRAYSAIHMRKDPPFDIDYIAATWLLDSATVDAHVFNAPDALRSINEKLAIFLFPEACQAALVSSEPRELLDFAERKAGGDAIIKPLTLFGGRGVIRLNLKDGALSRATALELLGDETANGTRPRLIQPFDKRIFEGEVRAFTVGGEPIAWCLKKPEGDNFLANTRAGARLLRYTPSPVEVERVRKVGRKLMEKGIAFVGFDLIGEYVSEINLTSPRLLQAPDDDINYYERIAAWTERFVKENPKRRDQMGDRR